jgi:predicted transcriptional regulator
MTKTKDNLKANEAKWGKELWGNGWTALPNVIFKRADALGLEAADIGLIITLASFWWYEGNNPHPSKKTLAKSLGLNPRSIQRRIKKLEDIGFIKRISRSSVTDGRQSNFYDFSGLIEAAKPYALNELREKQDNEEKKQLRLSKKKPLKDDVKKDSINAPI